MTPDPNYPRMMFHPSRDPVIVKSEEEEAALGAGWSRTVQAVAEHFPPVSDPAPGPDKPPEAPPARRKRGRPPAVPKITTPE